MIQMYITSLGNQGQGRYPVEKPELTKKVFDLSTFSVDLYNFRKNKVKLSRPEFGLRYDTTLHVIEAIEKRLRQPCLELAYNLCMAMGKKLEDYFVLMPVTGGNPCPGQ